MEAYLFSNYMKEDEAETVVHDLNFFTEDKERKIVHFFTTRPFLKLIFDAWGEDIFLIDD